MPAKAQASPEAADDFLAQDAQLDPLKIAADLPKCSLCKIGFLYPIAQDDAATHEEQDRTIEGDPTAHDHFVPSGGAIRVFCFNCQRGSSHPMNPGGE